MQIHDRQFDIYISSDKIKQRIDAIAAAVNEDYAGKNPLFLSVLNGAFIFAADIYREITIPSEMAFIKLKSYKNMETTGKVRELLGLEHNIFDRNIIIIDDIVDTGKTLDHIMEDFKALGAKSIEIMTLLYKPGANDHSLPLKYVGFDISNDFVVGYGMDYNGYGRNLKDIYKISS